MPGEAYGVVAPGSGVAVPVGWVVVGAVVWGAVDVVAAVGVGDVGAWDADAVVSKATAQAALFARFGVPVQIRPDVVDEDGTAVVRVYVVGSEEAARAFVAAEAETWANRARAELREGAGWCVIVDLRPRVAARKATVEFRRSVWSR